MFKKTKNKKKLAKYQVGFDFLKNSIKINK